MKTADFGRRYFSRPPQRSLHWWLYTIWLLLVLSIALVFGKRLYARLNPDGLWWLCLSVVTPIVMWLQAWKSHSRLYRINLEAPNSDLVDRTRLDAALAQAAYLENTGLAVALFVLMSALVGLAKILAK